MLRYLRRFFGVVFFPTLAASQQPLRLQKPEATYPEPFTFIASIREVPDGRVLVLDRRDRIVLLIDFRSGKAVGVGEKERPVAGSRHPRCSPR